MFLEISILYLFVPEQSSMVLIVAILAVLLVRLKTVLGSPKYSPISIY
jgi:hypothetical protein